MCTNSIVDHSNEIPRHEGVSLLKSRPSNFVENDDFKEAGVEPKSYVKAIKALQEVIVKALADRWLELQRQPAKGADHEIYVIGDITRRSVD